MALLPPRLVVLPAQLAPLVSTPCPAVQLDLVKTALLVPTPLYLVRGTVLFALPVRLLLRLVLLSAPFALLVLTSQMLVKVCVLLPTTELGLLPGLLVPALVLRAAIATMVVMWDVPLVPSAPLENGLVLDTSTAWTVCLVLMPVLLDLQPVPTVLLELLRVLLLLLVISVVLENTPPLRAHACPVRVATTKLPLARHRASLVCLVLRCLLIFLRQVLYQVLPPVLFVLRVTISPTGMLVYAMNAPRISSVMC